jgi:hypothetical protein
MNYNTALAAIALLSVVSARTTEDEVHLGFPPGDLQSAAAPKQVVLSFDNGCLSTYIALFEQRSSEEPQSALVIKSTAFEKDANGASTRYVSHRAHSKHALSFVPTCIAQIEGENAILVAGKFIDRVGDTVICRFDISPPTIITDVLTGAETFKVSPVLGSAQVYRAAVVDRDMVRSMRPWKTGPGDEFGMLVQFADSGDVWSLDLGAKSLSQHIIASETRSGESPVRVLGDAGEHTLQGFGGVHATEGIVYAFPHAQEMWTATTPDTVWGVCLRDNDQDGTIDSVYDISNSIISQLALNARASYSDRF